MKIRKAILILGIILVGLIVGVIIIAMLPWLILWFGLMILPNPPKPTICYGEFPFTLTYELDGETKVIEDVIVCEFDGYGERSTAGQNRKWKIYLKSEGENSNSEISIIIPLLNLQDKKRDTEEQVLRLYFYAGTGHYYMGDRLGNLDREPQSLDRVECMYQKGDRIYYDAIKEEEALEKYNIRLIHWEVADSIENNFIE